MKLLTFHLTDIFFCKNPKFNEFADDKVYIFCPLKVGCINVLCIKPFFFLPCLNILQININFWVFISSFKQCASSAPPLFRSKLIISTRIKSDKDTQTFTIRINRVVRFLQTVHDSPHIAKSTLRKIVSKVGFVDTSNSKKEYGEGLHRHC